jgi:hypothetical protein
MLTGGAIRANSSLNAVRRDANLRQRLYVELRMFGGLSRDS